jgi:hypothetical protein
MSRSQLHGAQPENHSILEAAEQKPATNIFGNQEDHFSSYPARAEQGDWGALGASRARRSPAMATIRFAGGSGKRTTGLGPRYGGSRRSVGCVVGLTIASGSPMFAARISPPSCSDRGAAAFVR